MSKICALVSGGLDSSAMLYELSKNFTEVYPLYIKFGLYWEKAELYWLHKFLSNLKLDVKNKNFKKLKILKISAKDVYNNHWSITGKNMPNENAKWDEVYIPGRNIFLLSVSSIFCAENGINTIGVGILRSNPFNDASEKFFISIGKALSTGLNKKIKIIRPFSNYTKDQLILKYGDLPLELTLSCINTIKNNHCGKCTKCYERRLYFKKAGIKDKTVYKK